jgi:hydrogenase maturation protease
MVLGVGNPIMSDDGVGLALLARLEQARPSHRVAYVDGGTGGMSLLPEVEAAARLLVLDAVAGGQPGEVRHLSGDEIPRLLASKLSPHQIGLLDVLTAARLRGAEPALIEVVGVVPASVELAIGLTEPVQAALDEATARALAVLDAWLAEV